MIQTKRVYQPAGPRDGTRYLVERLWPRGMKKEALKMEGWLKEVAPSDELRRWFNHDPAKWTEFQRRYSIELNQQRAAWEPIVQAAQRGTVTLLYSAHDEEYNNAVALKRYLERHLSITT